MANQLRLLGPHQHNNMPTFEQGRREGQRRHAQERQALIQSHNGECQALQDRLQESHNRLQEERDRHQAELNVLRGEHDKER